jgi:CrcB protein
VKKVFRYPSLWIATGGAIGALSRHGIELAAASLLQTGSGFPWTTFVINLSGAFCLGWILARVETSGAAGEWLRCFAGIGFCGAYTTFSTMNLQMVQMVHSDSSALALVYFAASFSCGIAVVWAGAKLGMDKKLARR